MNKISWIKDIVKSNIFKYFILLLSAIVIFFMTRGCRVDVDFFKNYKENINELKEIKNESDSLIDLFIHDLDILEQNYIQEIDSLSIELDIKKYNDYKSKNSNSKIIIRDTIWINSIINRRESSKRYKRIESFINHISIDSSFIDDKKEDVGTVERSILFFETTTLIPKEEIVDTFIFTSPSDKSLDSSKRIRLNKKKKRGNK